MFSTKYKKEIEDLKMELHKKNCDNIDLKCEIEEYKIELFKMVMKYNAWVCEYNEDRYNYGEKGYIVNDGEGANVYIPLIFVLNFDVNYLVGYIEKEFDSCHNKNCENEDIKEIKREIYNLKSALMYSNIYSFSSDRKNLYEFLKMIENRLDKILGE